MPKSCPILSYDQIILGSFPFSAYKQCTFTERPNQAASGADLVPDVDTRDGCLDACITNSDTCKAVEFSESLGCYMHTSADFVNTLAETAGVTNYAFIECSKHSHTFSGICCLSGTNLMLLLCFCFFQVPVSIHLILACDLCEYSLINRAVIQIIISNIIMPSWMHRYNL